ncbi:hypothetical protein [Aminobacter aminovorans]|uniref:hypothetical protein n=1 Tax=Aminobacter TaxID=31988 RepID=UPI0028558796|nr:hypothetical protein [Aminobacter aminovorans]MDR7225174.1 hypothetical protein [Aminobacter aminovorans]
MLAAGLFGQETLGKGGGIQPKRLDRDAGLGGKSLRQLSLNGWMGRRIDSDAAGRPRLADKNGSRERGPGNGEADKRLSSIQVG